MPQNTPVTEYMTPKSRLIVFHPEQSILEVINLLLKHKISGAPVLNEHGELIGMISEKDCLRVLVDSLYHNMPPGKVKDYMSQQVTSVKAHETILQIAEKFLGSHFKRFPVIDTEGKLIGQISRADVLKATHDIPFTEWH